MLSVCSLQKKGNDIFILSLALSRDHALSPTCHWWNHLWMQMTHYFPRHKESIIGMLCSQYDLSCLCYRCVIIVFWSTCLSGIG